MSLGAEFWRKHLDVAYAEGGLLSEYAKRNELKVTTLYYWHRKFREQAEAQDSTGHFVALNGDLREPHTTARGCTLTLPSGVELSMPAMPSPEWVAHLVYSLRVA